MKTAIIVLSDPKSGTEESLGAVFNALAVAHDFKQANEEVQILFTSTGTRWPAVLSQLGHPLYNLYQSVLDKVTGLSCGCADTFGAQDQGLKRLTDNPIPGTTGLPSLVRLQREGWQILTF